MIPTTSDERGESSGTATSGGSSRSPSPQITPTGFEQRLLARARGLGLGPGDRVVVAYSGGPDSLALASAMRWVERRIGSEAILVHVDHRLRPSSGDEARAAAALAETLRLPCRVESVAAPPQELHPGVGIEEAARRERYRILFRVARETGATAVATGHNQEDQAESVLLHLLRGGGVHGAAAMAEITDGAHWATALSDISRECKSPVLWRPLLHESRVDIRRYLDQAGLDPMHDPSNEDRTLRRNVLRRDVLPLLEAHFPGAGAALARYAELAATDDVILDQLAAEVLEGCVHQGGALNAACLASQALAMRRRMVRQWLAAVPGAPVPTMDRTDEVLALALAGAGGRAVEIGEGWTVRLTRGMLHAERTGGES
jgi:tRNA(Ile)-lysidine synthase